jgi:hypothetical protein
MATDTENAPPMRRRIRLLDRKEQLEFRRLSRQLLDNGMTEEELASELEYAGVGGLRSVLDTGRTTLNRLEKLRTVAEQALPHLLAIHNAEKAAMHEARTEEMLRRFEKSVKEANGAGAASPILDLPSTEELIPAKTRKARSANSPRASRGRKMGPKLSPVDHARFRTTVDAIREADPRFKPWSAIGKALGMTTGTGAVHAYNTGTSERSLRLVRSARRLIDTYGTAVYDALHEGVAPEKLKAHLAARPAAPAVGGSAEPAPAAAAHTGEAPAPESPPGTAAPTSSASAPQMPAAESPSADTATSGAEAATPAAAAGRRVDFTDLVVLSREAEAHIGRLWEVADFFDRMGTTATLPGPIRALARGTQEQVLAAIMLWDPDAPA